MKSEFSRRLALTTNALTEVVKLWTKKGSKPRRLLGRTLGKTGDIGIWVMLQLKNVARLMEGDRLMDLKLRKILLSELLALAKEIQQPYLKNEGDNS